MPKQRQSLSDFQAQSLEYLSENTPFTNVMPGSSARSITDIVNLQMANLSSHISELSYNSFLDTAAGYYLDLIGSMFNLTRYFPTDYVTSAGDKNIKFFTNGTDSLKRVLNSNTIPAGTIINSADGSVTMSVIESVTFEDTATYVFVGARMSKSDNTLDIGPNQMTIHNLGGSGRVFVTNTSRISYSSVPESDDSFRDRISSAVIAAQGPTEARIISSLRQFPDIADIDIRENVSGTGTYDVYLVPTGNRISENTIKSANNVLLDVSGFGISFNIREFDYIPIKLEIKVTFSNTTEDSIKQVLIRQAESAVETMLGNLRPNERLSMSRVSAQVLNISSQITSAEVVYLCINNKVRAITDLVLEDDELFVPDENEVNPIMVRQ